MKKFVFVEPVVVLYCFGSYLTLPLLQQYIYRRIWEDTTNTSFIDQGNMSHCDANKSNPIYAEQKEVQKRASLFSMTMDLSGLIPSLLVTLLIVAYGDRHGRKPSLFLPSLGAFVGSSFCFCVSYFSWPLEIFVLSSVITGFLGGFATFLGGCFSYAADISRDAKEKTIRIALVDMILGVSSGLAGISSGYVILKLGFTWSFAISAVLHFLNMVYIVFFLQETVKKSDTQVNAFSTQGFKEVFSGVFLLFKNASSKKRTLISLMLCAFLAYLFQQYGSLSLFNLYELDSPLCWGTVLIGWGSALSTFVFLTSFMGVFLFTKCLQDSYIIFIGLSSWCAGILMTAFAKTTLLMFVVRLPLMLAVMPYPILRSMMSKVVLDSEQGALFACIACLESLTGTISAVVFSRVYAATVLWLPGFSFLLSAGLTVIPFGLVCVIMYIGYQAEDSHELLINEDNTEEDAIAN